MHVNHNENEHFFKKLFWIWSCICTSAGWCRAPIQETTSSSFFGKLYILPFPATDLIIFSTSFLDGLRPTARITVISSAFSMAPLLSLSKNSKHSLHAAKKCYFNLKVFEISKISRHIMEKILTHSPYMHVI